MCTYKETEQGLSLLALLCLLDESIHEKTECSDDDEDAEDLF